VDGELLATLRCPRCDEPLTVAAGDALHCATGHRFPLAAGVPVLLDRSFSLFGPEDISAPERERSSPGGPLRRLAGWLTPASSLSVGTEERYRRLAQLLDGHEGRAPVVLVIGGGQLGHGLEALLCDSAVRMVETDVYLGPRTVVVCDGHRLPFADGAFDGVVVQAVLEHVADPPQVVAEIHRVLAPRGLVYAETPFMQQVHEGGFDFTRFTDVGHRRLFRHFEQIDRGVVVGPATALLWSLRYFARALPRRAALAPLLDRAVAISLSWLRLLDRRIALHPGAVDGASGVFFLGRRSDTVTPDREIVASYAGTIGRSVARRRGLSGPS
jgi:SAM-dependent methyltransferase